MCDTNDFFNELSISPTPNSKGGTSWNHENENCPRSLILAAVNPVGTHSVHGKFKKKYWKGWNAPQSVYQLQSRYLLTLLNYYYSYRPQDKFYQWRYFLFRVTLCCKSHYLLYLSWQNLSPSNDGVFFFFEVVHGKSTPLTPDSKNKKKCL